MKNRLILAIWLLGQSSFAQMPHTMPKDTTKPAPHHHMNGMDMGDMKMDDMGKMDMSAMSSAYSLSLPMSRNGSGTGWQPDDTPMEFHQVG